MVYSALGTVGPRAAAAPGGRVSREWWLSPVKQWTTRLNFAWLASVSGTCHVELDELPDLINKTSRRFFFFFVLFESNIKMPDG